MLRERAPHLESGGKVTTGVSLHAVAEDRSETGLALFGSLGRCERQPFDGLFEILRQAAQALTVHPSEIGLPGANPFLGREPV